MIIAKQNPPMKKVEIERFRAEMLRRLSGELTSVEKKNRLRNIEINKSIYENLTKNSGGINPIISQ